MSYLNINSVQSFNFSPENKYAQEYYNAHRQLVEARYKLTNTEPDSKAKEEALKKKFEYWNKKTEQISALAKKEETKLETQNEEQNNILGQKINYLA